MPDIRTIPVSNGHLAYVDVGQGPPIVLLHGGALDHRMWSRQLASFTDNHRVVAPDARGHGDSSTPTQLFRHCDDVAELIRALDLGPVTLVGLSMGAGTAVDTAVEYPELVSKLVVSGTGTSDPDWRDPWVLDWFATSTRHAQAMDAQGWIDTFVQLVGGPHRALVDVDPQVVTELREQATKTLTTHLAGGAPVLPEPAPESRRRSRDIPVPVLALPGGLDSDDHIRLARELADNVADGSCTVIDGTAHYPNMERPAEFNRLVRDFID